MARAARERSELERETTGATAGGFTHPRVPSFSAWAEPAQFLGKSWVVSMMRESSSAAARMGAMAR